MGFKRDGACFKEVGRLVLITDNANYRWYSVGGTVHLGSYEKDERSEDRHYALFTSWHLKNHLRKAGSKVVSIEYVIENRDYFRPKAIELKI